jgi:hypothetical protein
MKKSGFQQDPAQLLKKTDAHWRAKLGPLYGKFFVAPGVRWPSEFNEQGLWEPLPPKKPAESVRFAREELRLKKVSGAELATPHRFERVTPTVMAATASAYRNSDELQSAKKRDFLSREDISELIDGADFSRATDAVVVRREGRIKGSRNYRRRHLVAALKGIWRAASNPFGKGELLCFASVEGYAIEAGVSERALRYNLRELERIGVLQMVAAANTIRRPATYRLNLSALKRRRTYEQLKQSRPPRRALHSMHSSSPPAQEAAPPQPPAAAPVAVASPPAPSTPKTGEEFADYFLGAMRGGRARRLTPREGPKLVQTMVELMRGYTRHVQIDGLSFKLQPDDPRYRAPMSQENAAIAAAMQLGIPHESVIEHLKLCQWKLPDETEPNS